MMRLPSEPSSRLLVIFGAASFAAVSLGALICALSGVPVSLWGANPIAWCIGAAFASLMMATYRRAFLHVALWLAPVALVATFISPGQQGVHRWLDLGPLSVNAAMLVMPGAVVAFAVLARSWRWAWKPSVFSLAILAAQPDASQATALAGVIVFLALTTVKPIWQRLVAVTIALIGLTLVWMRPDPLLPVAEVEEVIALGGAISPVFSVLAWLALLAFAVVPMFATHNHAQRLAGGALTVCFALWCGTTLLGAFPVPLVGVGLSPIIGAWLGVGLLAGLIKRS